MKYLLLLCQFGLILIISWSCSKKNDLLSLAGGNCGDGIGWVTLVAEESVVLSQMSSNYSENPTPQNCQKLKDAYTQYVLAMRDVVDCVTGHNQESYQESLESAEREKEQLCQ